MTKHDPIKAAGRSDAKPSLLERAGDVYDFAKAIEHRSDELKAAGISAPPLSTAPSSNPTRPTPPPSSRVPTGALMAIDRDRLREGAFIVPDGAVTSVSEEFRIIKRRLLLNLDEERIERADPIAQRILVCSAQPNEGKTYCAINLALSIAAEHDFEALLVDADFAKPSILSALGIEADKGLMDALANPDIAVEDCIVHTDIPRFAVLPAGKQTNNDTEYLASAHTRQVLAHLTRDRPRRIVVFDSPPALAASPAAELAMHVGQAVLVVRADQTSDTALRDALGLLSGCDNIQLLLNGVKFSPTGRSFGSYYGYRE